MQASAQEVNQLIDEIKQDANTQYNGQYMFSGTATSTAALRVRIERQLRGQHRPGHPDDRPEHDARREHQPAIGAGQRSAVSGQPAGDGMLLNTLRKVADDMQSGNSGAVNSEMPPSTTNLNSLNGLSANVGAIQDRLQMASSRIETMQTSDTQVLSNTQDADMASTRSATRPSRRR